MNESNRALIVKLRERKGWDLFPGNYLEIKKKIDACIRKWQATTTLR